MMPLMVALLPGCAVAPLVETAVSPLSLAATASATGGTWATQARGFGGAVSDNMLALAINDAWLQRDLAILRKVSTGIVGGRVMLTGTVVYPKTRDAAVATAQGVPGVREVIDEIMVRSDLDLGTVASDRWITTRLRAALVVDADVSAVNYSLDTVDGHVFVLGIARDAAELDRVLRAARAIPGVRAVVSHVLLRSEAVAGR